MVNQGGTFTVTVTDQNGCSGEDQITTSLLGNPTPVITTNGGTTFCEGESLVLDGGTSYATYDWSTGDDQQTLTIGNGGVYILSVSDENGCIGNTLITITTVSKPVPTISADGPIEFCSGGVVGLDAGSGYTAYLWSSNEEQQSIVVSTSDTYTVTVSDTNTCSGSNNITVNVFENPEPIIVEQNGVLSVSNMDIGTQFQWFQNEESITDATTDQYIPTMNADYSVEVIDENNCTGLSAPVAIVTGVEELSNLEYISLFPNPSTGMFSLEIQSAHPESLKIHITNALGETVWNDEVTNSLSYNKKLDLGTSPSGLYIFHLRTREGQVTRKVLIQK